MHFVIAGGSGFIGGYLTRLLIDQCQQVTIISHSDPAVVKARLHKHYHLNDQNFTLLNYQEYQGEGDILINLAGESLGAKAITTRRLNILRKSRFDVIEELTNKDKLPPIFIQASGISLYPNQAEPQGEHAPTTGTGEIATLARDLEERAEELVEKHHTPHYYWARFGIVLHRSGGFIKKASFIPPFTVIHGDNKIPFIELNDACNALIFLAQNADKITSGPVNFTSTSPATLKELLHCCYKTSKLPPIPIITGFLHLGDRRMQMLNCDQTILPEVLLEHGFMFQTPLIADVK